MGVPRNGTGVRPMEAKRGDTQGGGRSAKRHRVGQRKLKEEIKGGTNWYQGDGRLEKQSGVGPHKDRDSVPSVSTFGFQKLSFKNYHNFTLCYTNVYNFIPKTSIVLGLPATLLED